MANRDYLSNIWRKIRGATTESGLESGHTRLSPFGYDVDVKKRVTLPDSPIPSDYLDYLKASKAPRGMMAGLGTAGGKTLAKGFNPIDAEDIGKTGYGMETAQYKKDEAARRAKEETNKNIISVSGKVTTPIPAGTTTSKDITDKATKYYLSAYEKYLKMYGGGKPSKEQMMQLLQKEAGSDWDTLKTVFEQMPF